MTESPTEVFQGPLISQVLDSLPEQDHYFLVICTHNRPDFQLTGLDTAPMTERMHRLHVFVWDVDHYVWSDLPQRSRSWSYFPPGDPVAPGSTTNIGNSKPRNHVQQQAIGHHGARVAAGQAAAVLPRGFVRTQPVMVPCLHPAPRNFSQYPILHSPSLRLCPF
jgi:hypothetical protein